MIKEQHKGDCWGDVTGLQHYCGGGTRIYAIVKTCTTLC